MALNLASQARSEVVESGEKPCNAGPSAAGTAEKRRQKQIKIRAEVFMVIRRSTSVPQRGRLPQRDRTRYAMCKLWAREMLCDTCWLRSLLCPRLPTRRWDAIVNTLR